MFKRSFRGPPGGLGRPISGGLTLALLLLGCGERDRLIVEPPSNGTGPAIEIAEPSVDTTVARDVVVEVLVEAIDPDGVDTVYVQLTGAVESYEPITPLSPQESLRVGLQLWTGEPAAELITVEACAVDGAGNRSGTVSRDIFVR